MEFLEEAQVIRCDYCGSRLLVAGRAGILRYVVPEKIREAQEAKGLALAHLRAKGVGAASVEEVRRFYAPFWRMKAKAYRWVFGKRTVSASPWMEIERRRARSFRGQGDADLETPSRDGLAPERRREKELLTRSFDHTVPGSARLDLGLSTLGVRIQALPLRPFEKEDLGKRDSFLPLEISAEEAEKAMEPVGRSFLMPPDLDAEMVLESFMEKALAVIYYPLWYVNVRVPAGSEGILFDGVGQTLLKRAVDGSAIGDALQGEGSRKPFAFSEIFFLPFRCPNCGWDFPFLPFSRIHFCSQCRRLFRERSGRWTEMPYQVRWPPEGMEGKELLWIPFWHSRAIVESKGRRLSTLADLSQVMADLRIPASIARSQRPIHFYLPAMGFRNPRAAPKLGGRLTLRQPEIPSLKFPDPTQPVTAGASLAEADFRAMGPIILGEMTPPGNRRVLDWLKGCRIELEEPKILYLPFGRSDLFWKEATLEEGITFQANAASEDLPVNPSMGKL